MPFSIVQNDIARIQADAIVNPANPKPVVGAGTDAAIHAAAGPQLLAAREQIGVIRCGSCAAAMMKPCGKPPSWTVNPSPFPCSPRAPMDFRRRKGSESPWTPSGIFCRSMK